MLWNHQPCFGSRFLALDPILQALWLLHQAHPGIRVGNSYMSKDPPRRDSRLDFGRCQKRSGRTWILVLCRPGLPRVSFSHTCYKSLPHNNETLIFGGFSLIFIPHSNYEREIYSCIVHFSCFRLRDFELLHRLTFNNTDWVMKFQPNLSTIL